MTPDAFVQEFHDAKASAILRTDDPDVIRPAMDAAIKGGFKIIEFTLTCPDAYEHIAHYAQRDDLIVGAGTVLSVEQAQRSVEAGARCLVSPVMDREIIETANRLGVACMPGCHTATEMFEAHRAGAQLCKLFPAPGTGPTYVKSILAPMPFLKIVPTNGVHQNNAQSYLKAGAYAVGFTTALFDPNDLKAYKFDSIEARARNLLDAVRSPLVTS
ncbi:MAG: bifunctional 4-hydroxy-2-oxoglutarate aldolase/2-dehydro-3-deoxy-phosphogluconate aldolase [Planctomycetota bacterium]|nr:bifunctional 4-hydroxy-2-oxoglutarate aldolase/2-dehydro-3-deoxy-phosphogluconate aldolase [Planctomycetota bacterium]